MSITLGWPVTSTTYVSSGFGYRNLGSTGYPYHQGCDISTSGDCLSVANGKVVAVSSDSDRGNYVVIDHGKADGQELYSLYQHLKTGSILVKKGNSVNRGQKIATLGNTGKGTGVHLHFNFYRGTYSNPNHNLCDPRYFYPYTLGDANTGSYSKSSIKEPSSVSPITGQIYTADNTTERGYKWTLKGTASSTFEIDGEGYPAADGVSTTTDSGATSDAVTDASEYAAEYNTAQYFADTWDETDGTIGNWKDSERRYKNFYRSYRFEFGESGGMGYAVGNLEGNTSRPLHITFSISRSDLASLNTAHLCIWNLTNEHLDILEDIGVTVCSLYAGYGERLALIFQGTVTFCTSVKEGADWKTTIELVDGFSNVKKSTVSLSYESATTWKTIMDDIAKQCGTDYICSENTDLSGTVDSFSFLGYAGDALAKVCESNQKLTWSIQSGVICIKNRGESMENNIGWYLSPETGLIGSPSMVRASQYDTSNTTGLVYGFGFDVTYLLNPFIAVGSKVKMTSQRFDGVFAVASVSINGDNEGGSWQCKARLYPLEEGGYSDLEIQKMIEQGLTVTKSGFSIGGTNNNASSSSSSGSYWTTGSAVQSCQNTQMTDSGLPYFSKAMYTVDSSEALFNSEVLECAAVSAFTEIGSAETSITLFAAALWTQCNIIDYNGWTNSVKSWSYSKFQSTIANNHYTAYGSKWASKARGGYGTYWKDGCLWNTKWNVNLSELAKDVYSRWSAEHAGKSNSGRILAYKNPRLPNGVNEIKSQETGTFIFYKSCNSGNGGVPERRNNRSYFMSSDQHGVANCWSQYWYFDYGSPYEKEEFYKDMSYYWTHPDFVKSELEYESQNHTNRYSQYPNTAWKNKRTWSV